MNLSDYTHRTIRIMGLAIFVVLMNMTVAMGQQFKVSSFRLLPNDISAYINPVRDLNQEACALVKIVGNRDFVFSSPLGVVLRKNEVGETWIYLPRGTVQLTIKHPQWGVMRDYRLPSPLESRMTYELVLEPPVIRQSIVETPLQNVDARLDTALHKSAKKSDLPFMKKRQALWCNVLFEVGIHKGGPSYGVILALMRRHGIYVHYQTDFNTTPSTEGDCEKDGSVKGSSSTPYYTGKTKDARYLLFAGGMHRLNSWFTFFEGIGYGKRTLAWEKSEGSYLRNTYYSADGLSAEIGSTFAFGKILMSAGLMTIKAKYWEPAIVFGYKF